MQAKWVSLFFAFVGCCLYVIFLELATKKDPGCGNLLTFLQFLTVSVEGFSTTLRCGKRGPVIPIRRYMMLVLYFFAVSIANNIAFKFNISMTLHLIFRSGSLLANMLLGVFLLNKSYHWIKYFAVLAVSVGIFICTYATGSTIRATATDKSLGASLSGVNNSFTSWCIGVIILTVALIASARMGLYQEQLFKEYGKHPREATLFTHLIPLPFFLPLLPDIYEHINVANASESTNVLLPLLWIYMLGTVLFQCICVNAVFMLCSEFPSLTVTLVVTLRKFISLILSVLYFKNQFTLPQWFGAILVLLGTLLYTYQPTKTKKATISSLQAKSV